MLAAGRFAAQLGSQGVQKGARAKLPPMPSVTPLKETNCVDDGQTKTSTAEEEARARSSEAEAALKRGTTAVEEKCESLDTLPGAVRIV